MQKSELPPGPIYLLQCFPKLASPPVVTYIVVQLLQAYSTVDIPSWMMALAMLLSPPFALACAILWEGYSNRRQAARMGAVLPPAVPDQGFGGVTALLRSLRPGYIADGLDHLAAMLGGYAFNTRVLFQDRMITAEPDHLKAILATQFDDYERGAEIRDAMYPLLGTGVFAADGDLWKFHRTMTRPFFSRDRISHFDIFDRHAANAINQLKNRFQEGHPVDFQDLVAKFTLDSAAEFLFGNDVRSLSGALPYPHYVTSHTDTNLTAIATDHPAVRFVEALTEAQNVTARRVRFGVHWPILEFWRNKITKPMSIVNGFIDPIVAEAIEHKRRRVGQLEKDRDNETLLENLVNSTEDPIILRDEIMSLLVAGRDTTAGTLTFTIYMLAEHPQVLHRLRQEILEKVGPNRRPTYDDFRDMKFLRAVINETLRLYPVVPFNTRMSNKNTIWPNKTAQPFFIPAGTRVPFAVFLMHRRKDLWGPDALEFDPDRFLDHRLHRYLTPNPFIFLPFSAGPRICLGQQFAYHEASFFLVRLLQDFSEISLESEAQPPDTRPPTSWAEDTVGRKGKEKIWPRSHLTMYAAGGLWVSMRQTAAAGEDM